MQLSVHMHIPACLSQMQNNAILTLGINQAALQLNWDNCAHIDF